MKWAGGHSVGVNGYVRVHHQHGRGRHGREHVAIVVSVLGHDLPAGAVVHHVNHNRADNEKRNLVVLQSQSHHVELHRKLRVLRAGGDPWADYMCRTCGPRPISEFYETLTRGRPSRSGKCVACERASALLRSRAVPRAVKQARDREYYKRKVASRGV